MAKTDLVSAYLLHRRPYRESSWLLECFSYELGRISLIGRSSGKKQTQSKGILQAFTLLEIQVSGRGNLQYASQVDAQSLAIPLHGEALFCGLYINELLYYLLQSGLCQTELFTSYQSCLLGLAKTNEADKREREQILRHFEFSLLNILGYQLELNTTQGRPLEQQRYYHYVHGSGLVPAYASHGKSPALLGSELLAISDGHLDTTELLKTAKQISRIALQALLNGRELKSKQLFKRRA